MTIATGRVVSGKIVVEGDPFPEGATVIVLSRQEGSFELGPEEEAELLASIAEADAGDVIDGEQVLRGLRGRR
jgi:hypothetical protein